MDQYIKEDAIVFEGIDFTITWFLLMTKQYKRLAKHYVILDPNVKMTQEEIISKLKGRVRRIRDREFVPAA